MPNTIVTRGSGPRQLGGVYWTCPPELLVFYSAPEALDLAALRLAEMGIQWLDRRGAPQVFDWVGGRAYPTPESFLDEARRHGISRRLANVHRIPSLLRGRSALYIVHGKCILHPDQPRQPACLLHAPFVGLTVIGREDVAADLRQRVAVPVEVSSQ